MIARQILVATATAGPDVAVTVAARDTVHRLDISRRVVSLTPIDNIKG